MFNLLELGVDVIDISRIERAIKRSNMQSSIESKFVQRVYTQSEISYCLSNRNSFNKVSFERFAVRFAAKEAVMKSLGVGLGQVRFKDIEVVHHDTGKPSIKLFGKAKKMAEDKNISHWLISLSHSDSQAIAMVAACTA